MAQVLVTESFIAVLRQEFIPYPLFSSLLGYFQVHHIKVIFPDFNMEFYFRLSPFFKACIVKPCLYLVFKILTYLFRLLFLLFMLCRDMTIPRVVLLIKSSSFKIPSCLKIGSVCSNLCAPAIVLTQAFWITCNFLISPFLQECPQAVMP